MENINYEDLRNNLWKFHRFVQNKKLIDEAIQKDDKQFMSWLKEELNNSPFQSHIIMEYFKLKYFPSEYIASGKDIRLSFCEFQDEYWYEEEWEKDYESSMSEYSNFFFLNNLYITLKENDIDVDRPFFAQAFKRLYNQTTRSCLEEGDINFKDIMWDIYKDKDYDNDDLKNSYNNLVANYPEINFNFSDRKYYILRYYIDNYGLDEGVQRLNEKKLLTSESVMSEKEIIADINNIDAFYRFYNRYSNLFTKDELKGIFEKVYSNNIQEKVFFTRNSYYEDDTLKDVCYMLASFGHEDKYISINHGKEKHAIRKVIDADKYYDKIVDVIKKYNFSPLETYICVYLLTKNYKHYQYYNNSKSDDQLYADYSRNPYLILDNDWEVCAGYAAMANLLLNRLEIKSSCLVLSSATEESIHARLGVIIDDDKYKLKSAYIGDPTLDSRSFGIYQASHMFMEPRKKSNDGYRLDSNTFVEGYTIDMLPYQVPNLETLNKAISTVINKTLSDLNQNQRDEIIKQIMKSSAPGKVKYEEFLTKGRFEDCSDFEAAFVYKTQGIPLTVIGYCSLGMGLGLYLTTSDKKFRDALLEEYTTGVSNSIKTSIYDNTVEGFEKLTDYIQLKYITSCEEKENSSTAKNEKSL